MDDPYLEEAFARINGVLRDQVLQLQAGDDPHPVVLLCSADHEPGRRLLAQLGFADLEADRLAPLLVLTRARVRTLLNEQISAGLGEKLMSLPLVPDHAFHLIAILNDRIDGHVLVIEDSHIYSVGQYHLDVRTRMMSIRDENGEWMTRKIDW